MKPLAIAALLLLCTSTEVRSVTISTVPVGNIGNPNDPLTGNKYGGVNYNYRIATTEVTNAQYAAFLNAKASTDPLGLYNPAMASDVRGGLTQSGSSGSYTYAPKTNMADKPVNYVSWYDSIRFANWLNNGQGSGDTETGSYTLLGGTSTPSNGNIITRNAGATWFLASESEWYKAAYYQPAAQGVTATTIGSIPRRATWRPRPRRPTTLATSATLGPTSLTIILRQTGTAGTVT